MGALRTASTEQWMFPIENARLTPYAGPQCFPHLQDPGRRHANTVKAGATGELGADAARKQLTECWLKCDHCAKWRLVELASLPAVKPEEYIKKREGCVDVDWGQWLAGAKVRYDAFLQRHSAQEQALDLESSERTGPVTERVRVDGDSDADD